MIEMTTARKDINVNVLQAHKPPEFKFRVY